MMQMISLAIMLSKCGNFMLLLKIKNKLKIYLYCFYK